MKTRKHNIIRAAWKQRGWCDMKTRYTNITKASRLMPWSTGFNPLWKLYGRIPFKV